MRFESFRATIFIVAAGMPWFGSSATAQILLGEAAEVGSGVPVPGVFVALLDSTGLQVAGGLTDAEGRFVLRSPGAGQYLLRADRIGYARMSPVPIEVGRGTTVQRIELESRPVDLEGVRVEAEGRACGASPAEGTRLQGLWDQVRMALDIATWTEGSGHLRSERVLVERRIDPVSGRLEAEGVQGPALFPGTSFAAAPAEDLAREGFVRWDGESYVFHGLDASTILSDVFLATHCLRLRRGGPERAGLIGIGFGPTSGRTRPDVHGVLWLDERTAELRSLEYGYTWLPWRLPPELYDRFGGETEFRRLPGGAWIVQRWTIRMPRVDRVPPDLRRDRRPVRTLLTVLRREAGLRIEEVGGEVSALYTLEGERLGGPRLALAPTPVVRLDSLFVMAEARPGTGRLAPLYGRIERLRLFGGGTVFDREALRQRRPVRISHLLATVPGVKVVPIHAGGRLVPLVSSTRSFAVGRGVCPMAVYLDGTPFPLGDPRWGDLQSIDDLVPPSRLEAVEVYSGPGQRPPGEFRGSGSSCGVVALWTRRGD